MTVPYIVPIVALLSAVYFISHQEEKSKTNNQLKTYKSARPVLKYLAATQNINLSDEEIKQLHKTMNEVAKTMGKKFFNTHVAPKINSKLNEAISKMDANSTENELTKLVMNTVNTQVKGILKKHKSDSGLELYSPPPKRQKLVQFAKGSKRKKRKRTTKKSRKKKSRTKSR